MGIQVPSVSTRSSRRSRPQELRRENDPVHGAVEAEALDRLASLGIDRDAGLDIAEPDFSLDDLLTFAVARATITINGVGTLLGDSFSPASDPGSVDYVEQAQKDRPGNLARQDLGGLAVNTHALKLDIADAFSIPTGKIGGRAYRPYKSDHTTGHAIDVPGRGDLGLRIADWGVARASTYKMKYIIFDYRIWYPGKGWVPYKPSGSVSSFASDAGHVRHVHFSTY